MKNPRTQTGPHHVGPIGTNVKDTIGSVEFNNTHSIIRANYVCSKEWLTDRKLVWSGIRVGDCADEISSPEACC